MTAFLISQIVIWKLLRAAQAKMATNTLDTVAIAEPA